MGKFFLTLDLEEWYHLEYFQKYSLDRSALMIKELSMFFDLINTYNIKATVFVLGELIADNIDLIKYIDQKGHEIGIHGWDHRLLSTKTTKEFTAEILRTKQVLESIINKPVIGYRAPCFTLNNEKLEALSQIGIKYDSSYIQFREHPLYGFLNMNDFKKIDDIIYKKDDFYEFELPTITVLSKKIPISGGGYFRLFPKFIFNMLLNRYLKTNQNFVMYIHPFELTNTRINLKGLGLLNQFRFSIGRKNNLQKLDWFLKKCMANKFEFNTMSHHIDTLQHNV